MNNIQQSSGVLSKYITDPIERIVAEGLERAGLPFLHGDHTPDFYVPSLDLEIEVKQFYSPRAIRQLEGKTNIILIQGREAAEAFVKMIGDSDGL